MYDTQKRVALAKERIAKSRRRQARRSIRSLSALCALLFLSLLGTVGTVQSQPMDAVGMYGAILLHEGVGGYVLEAVISGSCAHCFLYQVQKKETDTIEMGENQ